MSEENELVRSFARESLRHLRDEYLPRLAEALAGLPEEDLWWSPHPRAISFGTILLHLEGNVRQWILSGLGGAEDHRNRASEFAATDGESGSVLLERLRTTVLAACEQIESMGLAELTAPYPIQGSEPTGMGAIYHVVEHFSWHTGQAVWIAKARAGEGHGIAFFDDAAVNSAKNG